jgi:hypothetical protein
MSRHSRTARLAVYALVFLVFGSARAEEVDENGAPGNVDVGTIIIQAGFGQGKPPSGFAPFSSVVIDVNTGGVIDLFLADDKSSIAGANTSRGVTAIISMLLMSYAENDPIYANREFSPVATVKSAKTSTDLGLGRRSELLLHIRNSNR